MSSQQDERPSNADKEKAKQKSPRAFTLPNDKLIFCVFTIVLTSLIVISLTTLILLMEKQDEISRNTKLAGKITETSGSDENNLYKEMVAGDDINRTVEEALVQRIAQRQQMIESLIPLTDDQMIMKEMNNYLSNLTESIIRILQDELGISQNQIQQRVEVVFSTLNNTILSRLKEELEIDQVHIDMAVHRAVRNMSKSKIALIRGMCQFMHDGKCFWVIKAGAISYKRAEILCVRRGAMAANIYNEDHYQTTMKFLRQEMLPMDTVWLGMTRDTTTGRNYLTSGEESTFEMSWATGYPKSFTLHRHLGLKFAYDAIDSNQGFFNDYAASRQLGIICEL